MNNIKTNALFFTLIALIFLAYGMLSFISPSDLIQWLIQFYGWDVEKAILLPLYIHEMTWLKLKVGLIIASIFMLYLFYGDKNALKEYRMSFFAFFYSIKGDLLGLTVKERLVLLAFVSVFTGVLVYYCSITPVQLDEIHTWLFFIRRGPLITAAYYPASNNHIAYNLLSIPWSYLLPPVWALRMVSLLSASATAVLFLLIVKRRYNFTLSIAGMLLLMSSSCFAWYAVQGRGYVLELFFLLTILYQLIQRPLDFATDRLLILGNALAMYCVPIALIPLAVLNGFYAWKVVKSDPGNLKRIIKTGIYSAVLIFLCYLPVLIFSGLEQLINNPFVRHIAYQDAFEIAWLDYLPAIWNFISGCEGLFSMGLLLLLLGGTILLYYKKEKFVLIFPLLLLLPWLFLQVYPVFLFERTWLWLVIPFACWCIEIINIFTRNKKIYMVIIAGVFFLTIVTNNVARSYTTNQLLIKNAQNFLSLKQAIEINLQGKKIHVHDDVLYNYLLYYQGDSENYVVVHSIPQSASKGEAVLTNWQSFNPSDGKLIWTDFVQVLYVTK